MKRTFRMLAVLTMCAAVGLAPCMSGLVETYATDKTDVDAAQNQAASSQQKIDELQKELDSLSANITDMQSYVKELDSKLDSINSQIAVCQNNIDAKQVEIDAKQAEIDAKQQDIDNAQVQLQDTQATETRQYDAMKKRIQYMYENGDTTFLDMIFSSKDMSEMLGRTEYISSITDYDRKQLQKLADTKEQINTLIAQMETDKAALDTQKSELETQKSELVTLKADLQTQQDSVNLVISEKGSTLSALEDQQEYTAAQKAYVEQQYKEQQAMAEALKQQYLAEQAANNGNTVSSSVKLEEIGLSGGFTWPIPGYSRISSEWSPSRLHPVLGVYKSHDGMDIPAPTGTPIVAAYAGTVENAGYDANYYGYGQFIRINHGSGVVTIYAHCSSVAVSAGQTVSAGQVIGYVGSTGYATGPHLHLSIYIEGTSCNPRDYFVIP